MNLLYSGLDLRLRSEDCSAVLDQLEAEMARYVAEWAPRRLFIHAGAVGWKGKAILIPGRSYVGKSALVAELVRCGATYYSDEYAVLDGRSRLRPYARDLSLREEGQTQQQRCSAAELGGRIGTVPLPVGVVLVTRYEKGARWQPRRLSPGLGALALLENSVSARRKPESTLETLGRVASEATILRGVRGEARDVAAKLLGM